MQFKTFDPARFLDSEEVIAEYLAQVIAEDDSELLLVALNDILRARSISKLAKDSGLSREDICNSLENGVAVPADTIQRMICAMGFRMPVKPACAEAMAV